MVKKPKKRGGRKPGDPNAVRSERLVMRMHPDFLHALTELAEEAGISRSLFIERTLLSFVSLDPRYSLDQIGRKTDPNKKRPEELLGSPASFQKKWSHYAKMRASVIGVPESEADVGRPLPDDSSLPYYEGNESPEEK